MKAQAQRIYSQLIRLHKQEGAPLILKVKEGLTVMLLDADMHRIAANGHIDKRLLQKGEFSTDRRYLYYREKIEPYYLGVKYIFLRAPLDTKALSILLEEIALFIAAAILLTVVTGYFLGRLFVAPMREAIEALDRFIQDTTHELNTPVSTVLTNLELIDSYGVCKEASEQMARIRIAAQTISHIYDNLTYLKLNHRQIKEPKRIDLSSVLHERIAYFETSIASKQLRPAIDIAQEVYLVIDPYDLVRMVDNLLSNAIKYNVMHGELRVELRSRYLRIANSGEGIDEELIEAVQRRFVRADRSEGGFGIGLDIVHSIAKSYGLKVLFSSKPGIETEVIVRWEER